ncbi:hypothetical protein DXG03_003895 [Asterophora parasitica]|uniref:Uncharacterized protein n=1 Tax=Asterophora parasitica TaxID=117018 RepID=A0A9P7GA58_9AGAR|nr:hypothetical protein DXG03_003895 [Asterophora parasitica]
MKSFAWTLIPSLLATGLVLGGVPLSSVQRVSNLQTVPNKFIVEVDTVADIHGKRSLSPHENLYENLRKRAVGFEVNKEFNAQDLFVGAALTLNDEKDVAALLSTPGVKAIRPVTKFKRPEPVFTQSVSGPKDPAVPVDTQSTHKITSMDDRSLITMYLQGVDKLHALGITGKGIKIGIIDTGIDYTHPALGGGIGKGKKVIGGYDFVGDNYDGTNTPVPGPDPLDQCGGHGTHVAGIIGANPGNAFDISGVAYDASLTAYRVFGCKGSVTDDIIVESLLRGVKEGQDILTLSLGGSDGWTESSSSVVASRIAASGKIVTIAAGNAGASGSWYTSSPGNGIDVISVASVDNTVIPLQNATVGGVAHAPITYFQTFPLPVTETLPIYAISKDVTIPDDACNPLPADTPDLSPYVVIVRRGSCPFTQKLGNVAAKGAKVTLIYDNGNGFAAISAGNYKAALIQATDGEFLVSQFNAGAKVTLTFPQQGGSTQYPNPDGGLISKFSRFVCIELSTFQSLTDSFLSYGPSNDFQFKPSVGAPGGGILSTVPTTQGSWGVKSGTSMATPFLAGSAALLFNVKGKTAAVAKGARTLFETTAQRVASSRTDADPLQTVTQQGAGLINVYDALFATTSLSVGQLVLNDTAHFKSIQTFTVKNTGKTIEKYTLKHVPAGTAVTVTPGTIFPAKGPVPLTKAAASVTLSTTNFTLLPGLSLPIVAKFSLPKGDASTYPVYSGFIEVSSGPENLHVTYLGLGASLKDKQVLDNTDYYFGVPLPTILDNTGEVQAKPTNYTFKDQDFPTVLYRLAFGTPQLRVDLVDSNIQLAGTINPRGLLSHPFFTFPRPNKGGSFSKVKIVGPLAELDYIPRHDESADEGYTSIPVSTNFANGTRIPNGTYRVLVRALKVTGDATRQEDYESWLSPIIGFQA